MLKISFAVIIPAFNEEKNIGSLLTELISITRNIIVVNDGSRDKTGEICKKFNIKTINNQKNQGKGYSLRKGLLLALKCFPQVDWIITLDADGQHSPYDIDRLLIGIKKKKTLILVGRRALLNRKKDNFPFRRYLVNVVTTRFVNYFFNLGIGDLQSGFRIYHQKIIPYLVRGTKTSKFQFETEILLEAWALNLRISEEFVTKIYFSSLPSRIKGLEDTLRWIRLVFFRLFIYPKKFSQRRKFQRLLKKIS
ncbi:MAG: glycosyltransferase family 2 protein [Candidatus Hodarchaeales archaeon]